MARNNIRPFPRRKRQKGDARERANRLVLGRTFVLLILCGIVLFIPLVATLYQLMIVDHDQYEEMAIRNQTRSTTLTASRGVIYDRNMNILASSATVETIFIDPNYLESCIEAENEKREAGKEYNPAVSIDFIATGLSDLLEVDADFVREQAAQTQYYYRAIKRKVPEETAEKVREFINDNELTGIINLELDSRRYYPYGSMAAQVLGFVNSDNVGGEGLEAYYDATLTGNAGAVITTKGNRGTEMLYTYEKYYDASDGNSLVLTLDMTVQYYLEKNLEEAIEKYDVRNGAFGIVMNVNTGEVLGMATLGSYDPNNHQEIYDEELREELERQYQLAISLDEDSQAYTDAMAAYNAAMATARLRQWRNRCVSDGYEPGSTFKPITLATGLETGAITLNDTYECTGSYKFEGRDQIVSCWKAAGHGTQTTMEALGNSCNIAFSNMGLKIGAETFYEYVKDFGFMEKTGIDLPGEETGRVPDAEWKWEYFKSLGYSDEDATWQGGENCNIAIGQGDMLVTSLQMAAAYCSIAERGPMWRPHLMKGVRARIGDGLVSEYRCETTRDVHEDDSYRSLVETGLEGVTYRESASQASHWTNLDVTVRSKTGTAEQQSSEGNVGWFCSFAPAEDPKYVVCANVDGADWGATTAMYVVRDIYGQIYGQPDTSTAASESAD